MRTRKLTDFMPIYKEGAAKPMEGEKVASEPLPELKSGDILVNRKGNQYIVHKVSKPKRDTGFQEPLFRLERTIVGNAEWTLDELTAAGMRLDMKGEKVL